MVVLSSLFDRLLRKLALLLPPSPPHPGLLTRHRVASLSRFDRLSGGKNTLLLFKLPLPSLLSTLPCLELNLSPPGSPTKKASRPGSDRGSSPLILQTRLRRQNRHGRRSVVEKQARQCRS